MLVHRFAEQWARSTPDAAAVVEDGRSMSYAELMRLSNRFANLFQSSGVRRGDRVVIAVENSSRFIAAYLGAMKAGAVAVPLPAGRRSDRFAAAVAECAPAACVIDAAIALDHANGVLVGAPAVFVADTGASAYGRSLDAALAEMPAWCPEVRTIDLDLAAIIYTSGSTGEPRGVMLTHRNIVANTRSIVSYLGLTRADRVMCVLPFHYVYGLSLLHTHLAVGGSVVVDNRFAFPNVVLGAMRQHQVTGFAGVPSTFALLLHRSNLRDERLPHLRYVTQAGGHMPVVRIREWLERGPQVPFYVMYGATEASARLTYVPPEDLLRKLGSIGRPIPNLEVTVLRDDGTSAAVGDVGELVARGANIAVGYWGNPAESRDRFTPQGYRTGDLGYADEDGFLFLVGRRHDMIKVGAHRIGAKEIEDVLHTHPCVLEAAVLGAAHEVLGETPVAFVALRAELPEPERTIQAFCVSQLAPHKVPSRVLVVPELPKLAIGKLDRASLRRMLTEQSADALAPPADAGFGRRAGHSARPERGLLPQTVDDARGTPGTGANMRRSATGSAAARPLK